VTLPITLKIAKKKEKNYQMSLRELQTKQDPKKPPKEVIYFFMIIIFLGMVFFAYNWWKCRQSRVLEDETEMTGYEFDDDEPKESQSKQNPNFRKAARYNEDAV
jgi:cytoskeletal protein RodZ